MISALKDVLCGSAALFAYFALVAFLAKFCGLNERMTKPTRRAASPQKHTARRANERKP